MRSVFTPFGVTRTSAPPGRVVREVDVSASYPRDLGWRTSPEYGALARSTSEALLAAMGGELLEETTA